MASRGVSILYKSFNKINHITSYLTDNFSCGCVVSLASVEQHSQ